MSAVLVTALLVVNIMFTCGLDISLQREYYMEGKDLFCAKLHCVENTREDNEISALVNMSVYRISELEGKIMLASFSESDSRVRDYKVTGSKVDGKFSKVFGELTVSFTKPSDCFRIVFGCEVYYTNRRGLIDKKDKKTKHFDQRNRKPLMLMTLEAKTPEFDKTIDKMSEFLKSFKDQDKLNSADIKMNLQFSTDADIFNQVFDKISNGSELSMKERAVISTHSEVVEKLADFNKTNIQLKNSSDYLTESVEEQTIKLNDLQLQLNTLNNNRDMLNSKVEKLALALDNLNENSSGTPDFNKTIQEIITAKLNQTEKRIQKMMDAFALKKNASLLQFDKENKQLYETQAAKLIELITYIAKLNHTNSQTKNDLDLLNITINGLHPKTKENIDLQNTSLNSKVLEYRAVNNCTKNLNQSLPDNIIITVEDNKTALCDTKTDGGGWIIIQRRIKGDVNFTRTWDDYKNGFGSTSGDFWIGNDVISKLTSVGYNELRFDMKYKGKDYYAVYRGFKVENEASKYEMSFTSFSCVNVEDKFSYHNGMKFTTIDSDNDWWSSGNCAVYKRGGWWYNGCHYVNVNGEWASRVYPKGIHWTSVTGLSDSLDFVEMKLRQM